MNKYLSNQRNPTSIWDFMSEVDRIFDEAWRPGLELERRPQGNLPAFQPQVDVREKGDCYLLAFDLPGMSKDQIKIDFQDGRLTVSGERSFENKTEDDKFHRVERSYGRFERTFQLPNEVDGDKIQARFEDGVLEVLVPKTEVKRPKSIAIEGEKKGLFSRILGSKSAGGTEPGQKSDTH
jgi:HSP20 family protein